LLKGNSSRAVKDHALLGKVKTGTTTGALHQARSFEFLIFTQPAFLLGFIGAGPVKGIKRTGAGTINDQAPVSVLLLDPIFPHCHAAQLRTDIKGFIDIDIGEGFPLILASQRKQQKQWKNQKKYYICFFTRHLENPI